MKVIKTIPVYLSLFLTVGFVYAGIIYVDHDNTAGPWDGTIGNPYRFIQDGIDAALDGDIVLVADGIYTGTGNRDLDFMGKAITVKSENGAQSCIIDCENYLPIPAETHRGFQFHSGEGPNSVLEGFTIQNGFSVYDWCWLEDCEGGGGILCVNNSSPTIANNIITGNGALGWGGGISCYVGCSPVITDNMIIGNSTLSPGGGIGCYGASSPIVMNNIISGNYSMGGGGIDCYSGSDPIILNNIITGNNGFTGGGISCYYSSAPMIMNNTIGGNSGSYGGGIFAVDSSPTITNSILWDDNPREIYLTEYQGSSTVTVSYSDVQGGEFGIAGTGIVDWGVGNIDANPMFVDATNRRYYLLSGSPCIDAGTPNGAPAKDIEGNLRDALPDMGAYEWMLGNTPVGTDVAVIPEDPETGDTPVTISFTNVTEPGLTSLEISGQGPLPPSGFKLGSPPTYYEINTTAQFNGEITVCVDYSSIAFGNESNLKLMHYEDTNSDWVNDTWIDRTYSQDMVTDIICALVTSLSRFAIFEAANTPPTANAGGPYSVDEGDSVLVEATGSDPNGNPLAYNWDLNNDGTFETPDQSVTFSAADLDGPSTHTIKVKATDPGGLSGIAETTVEVENAAPTVGEITVPVDPVDVSSAINASATFTDPGTLDTHTAVWYWDWKDEAPREGPNSEGIVNEEDGSGTVNGSYTYTVAGVYRIRVEVTDKDGDSGLSPSFEFVVVYNSEGGFVTGGGWINSPEGAYVADPTLTGKANFGFVSKYKKGATVPTGQTEFQFKMADLNFHSDFYDWLVVAGANAKYKGIGTINGNGNYGFMLTAKDADITPPTEDVDEFRIKIWDKDDGDAVVYDNKMGELDDSYAGTPIGAGSIKIHGGGSAAPARPSEFALQQSYPNPFNPDTWIPYRLREDADVVIRIYTAAGRLIRTLNLGYKPAGLYTTKEKAAYWDGRNEAGEQVASGIYFCTLQAGDFTATKKMTLAR